MLTNKRGTALAAIALGATLTLTGCFGNPLDALTNQGGDGGIGSIIEGATGGMLGTSEGEAPQDFPSEVPLVDGHIQGGFAVTVEGTKSWTVTVIVPGDSVPDAADHVSGQLVGAGFEASESSMESSGMTMRSFTKGSTTVLITVTESDEGTSVTYLVAKDV